MLYFVTLETEGSEGTRRFKFGPFVRWIDASDFEDRCADTLCDLLSEFNTDVQSDAGQPQGTLPPPADLDRFLEDALQGPTAREDPRLLETSDT